jgi:xylose isomerase
MPQDYKKQIGFQAQLLIEPKPRGKYAFRLVRARPVLTCHLRVH